MKVQPSSCAAARAARQRGQAMLLTVLLLGVGAAAVIYTLATPAKLALESDRRTTAALALAKEALIGRAAADAARPGSLPCPDIDNDGDAESPLAFGGVCPRYIGRLPWKTLGLPDLRDGGGERLWYALSPAFRDHPTGGVLNSDTAGQLTITGAAPANNVIAIVFAPGPVVGSQDRSSTTTTLCATTGTNILNSLCAGNYLEGENANGMPPADMTYATALPSTAFNDTLLAITSDALFGVVNVRVAKDAIAALETYRAANNYYPFANLYTNGTYSCDSGQNRGRLPLNPAGCGQAAWPAGTPLAPTGWFTANNWNLVTHYALSTACGQFALLPPLDVHVPAIQLLCTTAGNFSGAGGAAILAALGIADDPVIVTGVTSNARALVIVTGRAMGAQNHNVPFGCGSAAQCMEDAANTDGDATYVKPQRFPISNDRMALVCGTSVPCGICGSAPCVVVP